MKKTTQLTSFKLIIGVFILFGLITGISSCTEKEEEPPVAEELPPLALDCSASYLVPKGESMTLVNRNSTIDYTLDCNHTVYGDLIIEPGVTIQVAAGKGIKVWGAIISKGTEENPVTWTSADKVPGAWKGFFFNTESVRNNWQHTIVEYAGGASFDSNNDLAAFIIKQLPTATFNNVTLKASKNYGIKATYSGNDFLMQNFTITECDVPMYLNAPYVKMIDGGDFTGNTTDAIRVWGDAGSRTLTKDQTWQKLNVPYRIQASSTLWIKGAKFTLEEGTTMEFEDGAGISIGESDASALVAEAGDATRITFTGVSKTRGSWRGIHFDKTQSPWNSLNYVNIEYAGTTSDPGAIRMEQNPKLSVANISFKELGQCAFYDGNKPDFNPSSQKQNPNLLLGSGLIFDTVANDADFTSVEEKGQYCFGG